MSTTSSKVRRSGAWWQSLQLQMVAAALMLLIILVVTALALSDRVVRSALNEDADSLRLSSARAVLAQASATPTYAEGVARALAALFLAGERNPDRVEQQGIALLAGAAESTAGTAIVGLGLWPEPDAFRQGVDRRSFFWVRDGGRRIVLRDDFNDPSRISYTGEPWYTIGRFSSTESCTWSPVRTDLLTRNRVVTCTLPLLSNGAFQGVVTVDVSVDALQAGLRAAHGEQPGYGLLFDLDDQLIASTRSLGSTVGNVADLGQRLPALAPLGLAVRAAGEAQVNASIDNDRYQAVEVSALRDASRDLTRDSAERRLASLWTARSRDESGAAPVTLELEHDPLLNSRAQVLMIKAGSPDWTYVTVFPPSFGLDGAGYLTRQMLLVTIGFTAIAMLMMLGLVRFGVLVPLQRMLRELREGAREEREFEVVLDESARNEVGDLAAWLNERTRALREVADRAQAANTQLVLEVGQRKSAQESLTLVRERAEMTLKCIADAVITTDRTGIVDYMNAVAETLVGRSMVESTGASLMEVLRLQRADSDEPLPDLSTSVVSSGKRYAADEPIQLVSHRGHVTDVSVTAAPIRTKSGNVLGAVLVLRQASSEDGTPSTAAAPASLTGLATRSDFDARVSDYLDQLTIRQDEHALLQIDIDSMRSMNDRAGRDAGDEYLRHIGHLLRSEAGAADSVYHLGADKFLVLLDDVTLEAAEARANQLLAAMADAPMRWEGDKLLASASIGVARLDSTVGTSMELLRRAETATQNAKSAGGATVRRYKAESRHATRQSNDGMWRQRIDDGLAQNLFHLMGQPISSLEGNMRVGVELHVSLEDEEGFWASPDAFMPAAERSGQAQAVDALVIEQSFKFLAENPEFSRNNGFCSVNLSRSSVSDPGFLNTLFEAFQAHEVPPNRVCFELNESLVRDLRRETQELVSAMHGIGCRFCLDNHSGSIDGTDLLRRIRFDFVKLDQQSSARAMGERVDRIALESTVKVIAELGASVIAGKVDDADAFEPLAEAGVRYVQGYAVGRPAPLQLLLTSPESQPA